MVASDLCPDEMVAQETPQQRALEMPSRSRAG